MWAVATKKLALSGRSPVPHVVVLGPPGKRARGLCFPPPALSPPFHLGPPSSAFLEVGVAGVWGSGVTGIARHPALRGVAKEAVPCPWGRGTPEAVP